ncbi:MULTISPECIES: hypothetical protein [Streptomyces]|uniref:hypothetical protein n=1 Tax=Streptomyces TaxID=1883 RepID=UPI00343632AF
MPPDPAPVPARRAVSQLDHRIESSTGHDVDALRAHRDRGVLDEPHACLVDRHRELAQAETAVTFYRTLLHRLTSGEFQVDGALFERIKRAVEQLENAADERDAAAPQVIAALEPIESAARTSPAANREPIPAADQAALLAIIGGAKLYQHLHTGRISATTALRHPHPLSRAGAARIRRADLTGHQSSPPRRPAARPDRGRAHRAGLRQAHAGDRGGHEGCPAGRVARRLSTSALNRAERPSKGSMSATESTPPDDRSRRTPELDLRLDGFDADEKTAEEFFHHIGVNEDYLVPLAEHHTADGIHSFHVAHDSSATWDYPGISQYVALHLQRDLESHTFRFEHATLPLPAMAQSWLIHRGCPPQSIGLNRELGPQPVDEATRTLERRLMGDGDRFALGYSYTRDDPGDPVIVVALRDLDEQAPSEFRVVAEELDFNAWTYSLREGGFDTVEEALQWCDDRLSGTAGPLPPVRPAATSFVHSAPVPKAPAPGPPGRSR